MDSEPCNGVGGRTARLKKLVSAIYAPGSSQALGLHTINNSLSLTFNFVEDFWHKSLNGFEPLHHEPQGRELAAAVTDQLLCQHFWKNPLKPQGLEPSEGSS